ncbi:hypothetical protein ACIHCQ_34650 [Streptomyces sp. NPDC052236]
MLSVLTTIAIITHDRDIAAQLPRRVEILDGRIVIDTLVDTPTRSDDV